MREVALGYLQTKNFDGLITLLTDNNLFNDLLEDPIFNSVFSQYIVSDFLKIDSIKYSAFLYQCHCSLDYSFVLTKNIEEEVLKILIDQTGYYNYAIKLPNYKRSKEIIDAYKISLESNVAEGQKRSEKIKDFILTEKYSNNAYKTLKSIFNSPQEKEFYLASNNVFSDYLTLPNAAMSAIFDSSLIQKKYNIYFNFFLKSTIDFVIVETDNYTPVLFFELDSKSFHSDLRSKNNDNIKNILLTELGMDLIRVTKRNGREGIAEFIEFLKLIKDERNL